MSAINSSIITNSMHDYTSKHRKMLLRYLLKKHFGKNEKEMNRLKFQVAYGYIDIQYWRMLNMFNIALFGLNVAKAVVYLAIDKIDSPTYVEGNDGKLRPVSSKVAQVAKGTIEVGTLPVKFTLMVASAAINFAVEAIKVLAEAVKNTAQLMIDTARPRINRAVRFIGNQLSLFFSSRSKNSSQPENKGRIEKGPNKLTITQVMSP